MSQDGQGVGTDPILRTIGRNCITERIERQPLTNRASPASTNGFVVNHSHMKALVDPSLTELINPRMSLFTVLVSVAQSILCGAHAYLEILNYRLPSLVGAP